MIRRVKVAGTVLLVCLAAVAGGYLLIWPTDSRVESIRQYLLAQHFVHPQPQPREWYELVVRLTVTPPGCPPVTIGAVINFQNSDLRPYRLSYDNKEVNSPEQLAQLAKDAGECP